MLRFRCEVKLLSRLYNDYYDEMDMRIPPVSPEVLGMMMRDIDSRYDENLLADTSGADYYFIRWFVTDEMIWDMNRIEEDFMKNCYTKLRDFARVQWYSNTSSRHSSPEYSHRQMLMGLILNGAKSGDEYCIALIKYLFKTYHKSLYKQLKRFRRINADEVLSLSEDENGLDFVKVAIILTICSLENIQLSNSCQFLYAYINKQRKEFDAEDDERLEFMEFPDGLFEKCQEQVDAWCEEEEKNHPHSRMYHKTYWKEDKFVGGCLRRFGYPEDYLYQCMDNNMGVKMQLVRTLSVLKTVYPNRDFSYDEVQRYTHLYSSIAALADVSDNIDEQNEILLGMQDDEEFCDDETLFNPEAITVAKSSEHKVDKPIHATVAPVDKETLTEEDYLSEIDVLRKKLNQREMEYKQLKAQYAAERTNRKESEAQLSKYQNDRAELIALREFAYNLENEIPEEKILSVEELKAEIKDKNLAIIGGHINWVNKLKTEFPDWTYILPSSFVTVDTGSLENKDMIFFFTDHISHTAYGKFVGIARERKIPFGYLHGVNMEQVIRQIYNGAK